MQSRLKSDKFYDEDRQHSTLRFMVGEDPNDPIVKSRNQKLIEDENHYFVVVGTDQGRLYTFNPRNIDLTYTFFT